MGKATIQKNPRIFAGQKFIVSEKFDWPGVAAECYTFLTPMAYSDGTYGYEVTPLTNGKVEIVGEGHFPTPANLAEFKKEAETSLPDDVDIIFHIMDGLTGEERRLAPTLTKITVADVRCKGTRFTYADIEHGRKRLDQNPDGQDADMDDVLEAFDFGHGDIDDIIDAWEDDPGN